MAVALYTSAVRGYSADQHKQFVVDSNKHTLDYHVRHVRVRVDSTVSYVLSVWHSAVSFVQRNAAFVVLCTTV